MTASTAQMAIAESLLAAHQRRDTPALQALGIALAQSVLQTGGAVEPTTRAATAGGPALPVYAGQPCPTCGTTVSGTPHASRELKIPVAPAVLSPPPRSRDPHPPSAETTKATPEPIDWIATWDDGAWPYVTDTSLDRVGLARAMQRLDVGVAWDRHILAPADNGFQILGKSDSWPQRPAMPCATADYSGHYSGFDYLDKVGAILTINVRIGQSVVLLVCGPYSNDYDNESFSACAHDAPGDRTQGVSEMRLALLSSGPDDENRPMDPYPSLIRNVRGGTGAISLLLDMWAQALFLSVLANGVDEFRRSGCSLDHQLKDSWHEAIKKLLGET